VAASKHCLLCVFSALARIAAFYDANFDIFNLEFTRAVEWKNGNGYPSSGDADRRLPPTPLACRRGYRNNILN